MMIKPFFGFTPAISLKDKAAPPPKSFLRAGCLLLLLFLTSRLLLIFFGYDAIASVEDQEQGYIAIEFLSGLRAPLINYQTDPYTGGTLQMGLLAVPFIYFFGLSMLSLKMTALYFSLMAFILILIFIRSFFGYRAAVYAGLIWIFSPPLLTHTSLMVLGSHERLLPALALLSMFGFYVQTRKNKTALLFAASFFAGWSITWSYINLVTLAACLISAYVMKQFQKISLKSTLLVLGGFLAGAFQWLVYNLTFHFSGIKFLILTSVFNKGMVDSFLNVIKRPLRFHAKDIAYGLSFESFLNIPFLVWGYLYFILAAAMIIWDIKKNRQNNFLLQADASAAVIIFFRTYLILYPIFYTLSSFSYAVYLEGPDPWTFRYLVPYVGFALLYTSILISYAPWRKMLLMIFVGIGFLSQVCTVWSQPFGEVFRPLAFKSGLRPYVWYHREFNEFRTLEAMEGHLEKLQRLPKDEQKIALSEVANTPHFWRLGTPEQMCRLVLKFPEEKFRRYFFRRWARNLELDTGNPEGFETLRKMLQIVPAKYQRDVIFGAGRGFGFLYGKTLDQVIPFIETFGFSDKTMFYLTLGNNLFRVYRNEEIETGSWQQKLKKISALNPEQKKWIYRGMGTAMYRSFRFQEILEANFAFAGPGVPREEIYWGVGFYLGRRYYRSPEKGVRKIQQLDLQYQPFALEGHRYFHEMNQRPLPADPEAIIDSKPLTAKEKEPL